MLHLWQIIPEKAGLERALRAVRAARRRYRAVRTYLERPTRSVSKLIYRDSEPRCPLGNSSPRKEPRHVRLQRNGAPCWHLEFISL